MALRRNSRSLRTNPNGRTRCSCVLVATHRRAMFPVLGAICGCINTSLSRCGARMLSGSSGCDSDMRVRCSIGDKLAEMIGLNEGAVVGAIGGKPTVFAKGGGRIEHNDFLS